LENACVCDTSISKVNFCALTELQSKIILNKLGSRLMFDHNVTVDTWSTLISSSHCRGSMVCRPITSEFDCIVNTALIGIRQKS
jgi:hypothetical protein